METLIGARTYRLTSDGVLYVEVPMEVWGKAPLHKEPVTHVNFFTPSSLRLLLERVGVCVSSCRLSGYPHPGGQIALVIRAIGKLGNTTMQKATPMGSRETEQFLKPNLGLKLRRRLLMPSTIPAVFAYQIYRLLGKR